MSKNIVLCSDGTGNSGGKKRNTNVWRLYNAIDRRRVAPRQIAFYDDGVGTDTLRWLRILGGAFGYGLSRNLRQLYEYLVVNYMLGDNIFLFGFSRGAFTVRSLAGMICKCGVIDRESFLEATSGQRGRMVREILNNYRRAEPLDRAKLQSKLRSRFGSDKLMLLEAPIEFIGVWDTVDAVGLPFDDLKKLEELWNLLFRKRLWGFHDKKLNRLVRRGRQALALDDERLTFHPNVWDRQDDDDVLQVWFAGVHSNVGGGYPKDALSLVPLNWMLDQAEVAGRDSGARLWFLDSARQSFFEQADPHGRLYDSRTGLGAFYRFAVRNPGEDPLVHEAVYERIARGTENYAPKALVTSDLPNGASQ